MHMSKVSIRDVAALAGVSTATVSWLFFSSQTPGFSTTIMGKPPENNKKMRHSQSVPHQSSLICATKLTLLSVDSKVIIVRSENGREHVYVSPLAV